MKAYRRQKIAMIALIASMGITSTSYSANIPLVSPNDFATRPVITKMQKNSLFEFSNKNKNYSHKKQKDRYQENN